MASQPSAQDRRGNEERDPPETERAGRAGTVERHFPDLDDLVRRDLDAIHTARNLQQRFTHALALERVAPVFFLKVGSLEDDVAAEADAIDLSAVHPANAGVGNPRACLDV